MRRSVNRKTVITSVLAALIAYGIYCIVSVCLKIYPFASDGGRSFAWCDAYYQYMDFFSWFRDVLKGKQSLAYTFSSSLGQNAMGIYAYYLASPFNLSLIFCGKNDLHAWFNLVVGLKMALCSLTMTVYLQKRFRKNMSGPLALVLGISYGLMQYNFSQSSNLMWIDGVYLLPLILLGVYQNVTEERRIPLSITVGLSVLFNWYSGGMNCLAACIFFVCEYFIYRDEHGGTVRDFLRKLTCFITSMLIGLMLSAAVFLPAIYSLRQGRGSAFDWESFRNEFFGNVLNLVHAYTPGAVSQLGYPALFCGSFVIIGSIGFFFSGQISARKKLSVGFAYAVLIAAFFWAPMYVIFGLLKRADSYYYRFAYIASFLLIYSAAYYFSTEALKLNRTVVHSVMVCILLALLTDYVTPHESRTRFYFGIGMIIILLLMLYMGQKTKRRIMEVSIILITCCELGFNAYKVGGQFTTESVEADLTYNHDEMKLVDSIRRKDPSDDYRITQTETRSRNYQTVTANYDESMAFGYKAVENYTSCPQNKQLDMLSRLGYQVYAGCILAKGNSVLLPVDSLLGVKYVMSPYPIAGLSQIGTGPSLNDKYVFENPYALPLAFGCSTDALQDSPVTGKDTTTGDNPFERWNQVYSALLGKKTEIMEPIRYDQSSDGNQMTYTLHIPGGDTALYGNITVSGSAGATLDLNHQMTIPYNQWLAVRSFNIPIRDGENTAVVQYTSDDLNGIRNVQFYGLNLEKFAQAAGKLQRMAADKIELQKNTVYIRTDVKDKEQLLFTSIPFDEGWNICVNKKTVKPILFDDCLLCLKLPHGVNEIQMKYTPPGLKKGIGITALGILLLLLIAIDGRRRKEQKVTLNGLIRAAFFKCYHNRILRYIFFGGLTTLVNLGVYYFLRLTFNLNINVANLISISGAIVFAYFTNSRFVFQSKANGLKQRLSEFVKFVSARLSTMAIEIGGVWLMASVMHINDYAAKFVIQFIVLALNYIFSKLLVFTHR